MVFLMIVFSHKSLCPLKVWRPAFSISFTKFFFCLSKLLPGYLKISKSDKILQVSWIEMKVGIDIMCRSSLIFLIYKVIKVFKQQVKCNTSVWHVFHNQFRLQGLREFWNVKSCTLFFCDFWVCILTHMKMKIMFVLILNLTLGTFEKITQPLKSQKIFKWK